jgi:hypothetical protein
MTSTPISERNRELAEKINKEVKESPQHPYAGKFVGIANGQVVAVADNLDDIGDQLERIEPDNTRTFVLEVGADYSKTEYIWGTR